MSGEPVAHPAHYGGNSMYETIKVLEAWLTHDQFLGFLRGNAIKYLSRAGKKHGAERVDDQQKAEFYIGYEIDYLKRMANGFSIENVMRSRIGLENSGTATEKRG